jgi:hypothetical protein
VILQDDNATQHSARCIQLFRQFHCKLLEHPPTAWKVADTTKIRKWKWLFVDGCEYNSPIYSVTEFFKFVPKWGKCINALGDCAEKWWYFRGIHELHLELQLPLVSFHELRDLTYRTFVTPDQER